MQTKSGKPLHPIGIGTWLLAGSSTPNPDAKYNGAAPKTDNEVAEIEAIRYSLSKGQNHLDCAELYGAFYTDEVVGKALTGYIREDLFIADKLWKTSVLVGKVRGTVEQMLKKLQTTYLDALYIHAPWEDIPWQEAIPQINELIDEGIVRYFGLSNFNAEQMKEAASISNHPIAMNQIKYNVIDKASVTDDFRTYCDNHAIQIVAYQPIKRTAVLENEIVQSIANNHSAKPSQVAIAWLIAKDTLPIPKATHREHIDENLGALQLKLNEEEIRLLDGI